MSRCRASCTPYFLVLPPPTTLALHQRCGLLHRLSSKLQFKGHTSCDLSHVAQQLTKYGEIVQTVGRFSIQQFPWSRSSQNRSSSYFKKVGYQLPLPLFSFQNIIVITRQLFQQILDMLEVIGTLLPRDLATQLLLKRIYSRICSDRIQCGPGASYKI